MKYAVIKTGGKQYRVSEGDVIEVEHLTKTTPDASFSFEEVLLYVSDGTTKVGKPTISDMSVSATVIGHKKGEKIRVAKFKAKARHRRVTGHRQLLTAVKIDQIGSEKASSKAVEQEKPKEPKKRVLRAKTK